MAIILFTLAILLLWSAGCGAYFLLTKSAKQYCVFEFLSLGFLLGTICIALSSFLSSLILPRVGQQIFVTAICLALGFYGVRQALQKSALRISEQGSARWKVLPSLILLAQIIFVSFVGIRTPLSWDGLFNWEMKAKIYYEQGGIPKELLQSDALNWAHVDYPPLLPLNQAWTYSWIGSAHQSAGKTFCVIFYAIAVLLLLSAARNWSNPPPFNYALWLFGVPLLWVGEGSATTGHADFPLAVFFLAAAKLLVDFANTGQRDRLQLFGVISFGMAIVKQDSIVLLLALWAVFLVVFGAQRGQRTAALNLRWSLILLPATVVYGAWKIAMRILSPNAGDDFAFAFPTSWSAFAARTQAVSEFFFRELINPLHWGVLWLVFAGVLFTRIVILLVISWRESNSAKQGTGINFFAALRQNLLGENSLAVWALVLLVLIALGADFSIYLFLSTAKEKLTLYYWLTSSAARLLIQIAPVALLSIQALSTLPQRKGAALVIE